MILAVPEQDKVVVERYGYPTETCLITWYRYWCSQCRVTATAGRASHAAGALSQGDTHARLTQCHTLGQLELFPAGAR